MRGILIVASIAASIAMAGCVGPAGDDTASFPHVTLHTEEEAVITMEHVGETGGDCILLSDYEFRVDGNMVQPHARPYHDEPAAERFCGGEAIYLDAPPGLFNEVIVVIAETQRQVYKKTVEF